MNNHRTLFDSSYLIFQIYMDGYAALVQLFNLSILVEMKDNHMTVKPK